MENKTNRLIEIQKIIEKHKVSGQDDLFRRLKRKKIRVSQSTLSRDLKTLKIAKIPFPDRAFIYALPDVTVKGIERKQKKNLYTEEIISVDFSNNLSLIKTTPGYANGIASNIDELNLFEILGTIAGDDTILIIPREGVSRVDITNALILKIPELKKIIN